MILHVCDRCKKQIKWTKEVRTVVSDPGSLYHFTKSMNFAKLVLRSSAISAKARLSARWVKMIDPNLVPFLWLLAYGVCLWIYYKA